MSVCVKCGRRFRPSRSDQTDCCRRCRERADRQPYLVLPIKKKWFDMIRDGTKPEEYREIKAYWEKRFSRHFGTRLGPGTSTVWEKEPKPIRFRNGYGKDAPYLDAECTIREGTGNPDWGAREGVTYYVLTVGRILRSGNRGNNVQRRAKKTE